MLEFVHRAVRPAAGPTLAGLAVRAFYPCRRVPVARLLSRRSSSSSLNIAVDLDFCQVLVAAISL